MRWLSMRETITAAFSFQAKYVVNTLTQKQKHPDD